MEAAKTIAQAFILCRLDYCNSLLYSISDSLVQRLQSVQNAAARLVTGTRRCGHITPVLRQLHWLPVRQRIHFKIAGCIFQALTGQAPAYLAGDCRLISDSDCRKLRSSDIRTCVTPRMSTRFGDRTFSAAGPHVWNGLPSVLQPWCLTVLNEDLRHTCICVHWCDESSSPSDYWFLALYKFWCFFHWRYHMCVFFILNLFLVSLGLYVDIYIFTLPSAAVHVL